MSQLLRYVALPILGGAFVGVVIVLWLRGVTPPAVNGFADAVDRAAPAVVNIFSRKVVAAYRHPICRLAQFRGLCEDSGRMRSSLGSGVMAREDGYILTNNHVIAGADDILVAFPNGSQAQAAVVGTDVETDLAVIKVAGDGFAAIERADSGALRVGDMVLAIGNPFNVGQTVSLGIVSAKGRYGIGASPWDDFIQTDAAVHPGNSGGPLVDSAGRMVGVNTLIYSPDGSAEGVGIGFAIPSELAFDVLDQIIANGRVERGWLGVDLAAGPGGLVVARVLPGTPAARAGIRPGDIILAINGEAASSMRSVVQRMRAIEPGVEFTIRLRRQGADFTVRAAAAVRPTTGP